MPKKYFLVRNPSFFDSLDELTAYASEMKADDIEGLVVGTYVGELHLDTNMVLRNSSKVKKLKVRGVTRKDVLPQMPPLQEQEEPEVQPTFLQCSFCHRPKVKTVLADGIPTHLCEEHVSIERELLNVRN